jgi:hypothetical protein
MNTGLSGIATQHGESVIPRKTAVVDVQAGLGHASLATTQI